VTPGSPNIVFLFPSKIAFTYNVRRGSPKLDMITCPNCGAGNKPGSSVCRMCAVSLEGIGAKPVEPARIVNAHSAAAVSPNQTYQEGVAPVQQEGIICPECNTSNEIGWAFCQQCGSRLPASPPPTADSQVPDVLKTVVDQRAMFDPSRAPSLKTVAEKWPSVDEGMKTVVAKPPTVEPKPRIEPPPPPPVAPVHSVEPSPPPPPPPSKPAPWAAPQTVVAPIPTLPKPAAPPPSQPVERPSAAPPPVTEPTAPFVAPPPVSAPPHITASKPAIPPATRLGDQPPPPRITAPGSTTQHVSSVSGVLCSQCGQSNNVGSTFCANCGAPMTFGQTMVMSSQPAVVAVIGRLHLVMESGQAGEVYELSDDTVIGRNTGELNFPHDGFMSGRHARIVRQGNAFKLTDEGSRNGTFIKIKGEVELKPGDMILVGKQLFRFEV
jgi:ribosomal protein L40E